MSCIALPPNMLTLSQVSLLVSRASSFPQDDNNNVGCGALALKMMSSRCSGRALRPLVAPSGPKRCLFGTPSAADTQRLLREDQDAVKARMQRRWGWDLSREAPSAAPSTWQWEPVKARRHPYAARPAKTAVTPAPAKTAVTPVPTIVSPLPATPCAVLDSSTASSSSGTSTLSPSSSAPPSPTTPHLSSPTVLRRPATPESSWESESEDSEESDSSASSPASPRPLAVPVQTRITDFWRTRRCSVSESIVKAAGVPTASSAACSV